MHLVEWFFQESPTAGVFSQPFKKHPRAAKAHGFRDGLEGRIKAALKRFLVGAFEKNVGIRFQFVLQLGGRPAAGATDGGQAQCRDQDH